MHSDQRHLERLSYSLHDAVLGSSPLKARAAREEVQNAQCRLLRGRPQWQHTSYINKHKFQRPSSDWLLENAVTPEQLSRRDFRSSTTSYRFQLHRDAAFTRGDCTTNWDFSTVLDQQARDQRLAEQRLQDCKHSRQHAASLRRYASPMRRAQTSIEQQRAAKRAPAARAEELRKRWGVEGAAAMQQILQMRQPERRPHLRATREDQEAVAALGSRATTPGSRW